MVDDRYKDGFPLDYKEPRKEDALDKVWNYFKSFPSKLYRKPDTWYPRPSTARNTIRAFGWIAKPVVTIGAGVLVSSIGAPALAVGGVALATGYGFGTLWDKGREYIADKVGAVWEKNRDENLLKKFKANPNKYCIIELDNENVDVYTKNGQRNVESNIYKDLVLGVGDYRLDISGNRGNVRFIEDEKNKKCYIVLEPRAGDGMYFGVQKLGERPEETYEFCHVSDENCSSSVEKLSKLNVIAKGLKDGEIEINEDFNYSKREYRPRKKEKFYEEKHSMEKEYSKAEEHSKEEFSKGEEPVEKFSFHRDKPGISKGNSDFWKSNEKDAYSNGR